MITAERAVELLAYDPETGDLIRKLRTSNSVIVGSKAGSISNHGYIRISLDSRLYLAHRIAWLIMTGDWPIDQIDHINGCRTDNRWINLRSVSNQENGRNQSLRSTNKSGVVGVNWNSATESWRAQITVGGKAHHLGLFIDIRDAELARKNAEKQFAFHENHGRSQL